jgi:hypothetical protein
MDGLTINCVQQRRLPNWYGGGSSNERISTSKSYNYEAQKRHRRLGQHYVHALEKRLLKETKEAAFWRVLEEQMAEKPQAGVDAAFEVRFKELAQRWREETKSVSSTTDRALNGAYQDIIGMGDRVLPLIFREMEERGGHWFWALRHITHDNPVPPQDAGNVQRMREAWLQWGREHHYL